MPTVRRLTGGGAIWHHHEVTYALAVPASHPLARPSTQLYRAVHAAIAEVMAESGCASCPRGEVVFLKIVSENDPYYALLTRIQRISFPSGIKIVGSAQRRRGGAVLQHGSVLLARSCRTPELPGVCDVADVRAELEIGQTGC